MYSNTFRKKEDATTSKIESNSRDQNAVVSEEQRITSESEDPKNFIIPIYKKIKIRICKPLIPLRIALFMWHGSGSIIYTFLLVFFKQRGMTVTELSTIYLFLPVVQFLGPTISGITADKIGSSKPVLVVILLLNALFMTSILLSPDLNILNCDPQTINLECHDRDYSQLIADTRLDVFKNVTELTSCNLTCVENFTEQCNGRGLICDLIERNEDQLFSLFAQLSSTYKFQFKYYNNITWLSYRNTTYSECTVYNTNCTISCLINLQDSCSDDHSGRIRILFLNGTLLVLFSMVFPTTYRIFDVTAMSLVKEHNSNFGRERFFSMFGIFVFSTLNGYLVTLMTTDEDHENYKSCLYVFIGMNFMLLIVIYKLEVQIKAPGRNMWKKSLYLLKSHNVISFIFVLIISGSACGFRLTYLYWYLEGLGASSFLLGLINGIKAFYGLPFLLTTNWWMKKIGTTQVFLLGFCAYVVNGIAYTLLYDAWLSLLIETTEIITYHLLWVAVVVHSHSLAPEGLTATIISLAGAVHYNIGKGAGTFIGGLIMDSAGARMAFTSMAITCFASGVLYATYLYWRNKLSSRTLYFDHMEGDGRKSEN